MELHGSHGVVSHAAIVPLVVGGIDRMSLLLGVDMLRVVFAGFVGVGLSGDAPVRVRIAHSKIRGVLVVHLSPRGDGHLAVHLSHAVPEWFCQT